MWSDRSANGYSTPGGDGTPEDHPPTPVTTPATNTMMRASRFGTVQASPFGASPPPISAPRPLEDALAVLGPNPAPELVQAVIESNQRQHNAFNEQSRRHQNHGVLMHQTDVTTNALLVLEGVPVPALPHMSPATPRQAPQVLSFGSPQAGNPMASVTVTVNSVAPATNPTTTTGLAAAPVSKHLVVANPTSPVEGLDLEENVPNLECVPELGSNTNNGELVPGLGSDNGERVPGLGSDNGELVPGLGSESVPGLGPGSDNGELLSVAGSGLSNSGSDNGSVADTVVANLDKLVDALLDNGELVLDLASDDVDPLLDISVQGSVLDGDTLIADLGLNGSGEPTRVADLGDGDLLSVADSDTVGFPMARFFSIIFFWVLSVWLGGFLGRFYHNFGGALVCITVWDALVKVTMKHGRA